MSLNGITGDIGETGPPKYNMKHLLPVFESDYKTYTTEDEGYVFVCFDNVEDFTEFVLKHPEKDLK